MLRSAAGFTVTFAVELSLAEFGSAGEVELTDAVFVIVPALLALTTSVMNTVEPLANDGIVHVTGPTPMHVPPGTLAETNVAFVNESEITMLDAAAGPRLPTFTEKVAF
jgi:hypothetical protein